MIKREESRHDFAFMAGVVLGAVAGAVTTLALAPRAGTETRDRWRARMEEMPIDDLRARAASLRDAAASGTEKLREAASGTSAGDVVQSTRAKVTDLVDRSPLPVTLGDDDEIGETLADAAEAAEDRLTDETAAAADEFERQQDNASEAVSELASEAERPESEKPHS